MIGLQTGKAKREYETLYKNLNDFVQKYYGIDSLDCNKELLISRLE